jgi:hypothetical protein
MAGISQEDRAMTHPARILILAVFVMLTATVSAFIMNTFLMVIEAIYSLPRVSLYAPVTSVLNTVVASNAVLDPAAQAKYASVKEFFLIESAIFMCLVFLSSIFAFVMRNPKGIFTVICSSLFVVVPGIAFYKVSAPAYSSYIYRVPDVHGPFLDFQSTVLTMGLSVPFYAALFFVGILLLTEERRRAAGAQ